MKKDVRPSGAERTFEESEIIVSKTNLKGIITYANDVFERVSGYTQAELVGAPHSLVRHPDMPRAVFRLLWERISSGQEVFAYVNNLAKDGANYWVFAHVTPSYDQSGAHVGYHSSRRVPYPDALRVVKPLYAQILAEERRQPSPVAATDAGYALLLRALGGTDYGKFIFGLSQQTQLVEVQP